MKLTLETKDKTVVIELPHDEQTVTSIFDELLLPAIVAMGYSKENCLDSMHDLLQQEVDLRNG